MDEFHTLDGEGASRPSNLIRRSRDDEVKNLKILVPGAAMLNTPLLAGVDTIQVNVPGEAKDNAGVEKKGPES